MEWIGEVERQFATGIYPNRVAIAVAGIALAFVVAIVARRRRWDLTVRRRPLATTAVAGAALAVLLPLGWYLGSPLFISTSIDEPAPSAAASSSPPPAVAGTAVPATSVPTSLPTFQASERRGTFRGADDFHFGRGTARLIQTAPGAYTVRLENFAVRNGPDLYVYLSPSKDGYARGAIELGRLMADRGNQNYALKPGTEVSAVRSVVIWCKQFAVLFATAAL